MPKITKLTKINKDGGPGYRLTAVQNSLFLDQNDLNRFKELKIAIATKYGLVNSPYVVVPKKSSRQGHNIIMGTHSNFKSLFEFVSHHTFSRVKKIGQLNSLKNVLELETRIIPTRVWKDESLLVLIPENQEVPELTPPSLTAKFVTTSLESSLRKLADQDLKLFQKNTKEICTQFNDVVKGERDIYTLDYYLRYFGITLQHYRVGIDSPQAEISFCLGKRRKNIIFPIELKTHSRKFFSDASRKLGKGKEKYLQHFPLVVLCLRNNAQKIWKIESGVGIICIEDLIRFAGKISNLRPRIVEDEAA